MTYPVDIGLEPTPEQKARRKQQAKQIDQLATLVGVEPIADEDKSYTTIALLGEKGNYDWAELCIAVVLNARSEV